MNKPLNAAFPFPKTQSESTISLIPVRPQTAADQAATWLASGFRRGRTDAVVEVVDITPEMASAAMEHNTSNRPFREATAARYAQEMLDGRWVFNHEGAICFSNEDILINGQHRLSAILRSELTQKSVVWFGCSPTEYRTMDIGAHRTSGDTLAIESFTNCALRASVIGQIIRLRDKSPAAPSKPAILALARQIDGPDCDEALTQGARMVSVCSPTAAALAYLWIITKTGRPKELRELWDCFVEGNIQDPTNPFLRLRNILQGKIRMNEYFGAQGHSRSVKIAAAIILTWNSYVTKRKGPFSWPKAFELPDVK